MDSLVSVNPFQSAAGLWNHGGSGFYSDLMEESIKYSNGIWGVSDVFIICHKMFHHAMPVTHRWKSMCWHLVRCLQCLPCPHVNSQYWSKCIRIWLWIIKVQSNQCGIQHVVLVLGSHWWFSVNWGKGLVFSLNNLYCFFTLF